MFQDLLCAYRDLQYLEAWDRNGFTCLISVFLQDCLYELSQWGSPPHLRPVLYEKLNVQRVVWILTSSLEQGRLKGWGFFTWRSLKLTGWWCPAENNVLLKAPSAPGAVGARVACDCPRLPPSLGKGLGLYFLPAKFFCLAAKLPGVICGNTAIFRCILLRLSLWRLMWIRVKNLFYSLPTRTC